MTDAQTLDLIGQLVLGRYRIVRQLARGGMGAVYLGRTEGAEGFARPVVIKRILPWLTQDHGIAEMFVREARILSNMQHPSIVGVLDFGQQGDGSYLMVLEYVHGYDLGAWYTYASGERGQIPVDHAIYIVCKVLDALHYAHTLQRADGRALGIVHRDVTPTNVFLGEQGVVKLLDFGIALVVDEERKFTGRNEVRGKAPYLPAEVVGGAAPTAASDVYSVGVTLYELLSGTNPFDGRQPTEIFVKILTVDVPPLSSKRDDVPPQLDAVVARALSRDLEQRYKTAAEFALALRALATRSEEVVTAELAAQLRRDFAQMPEKLGVDSLAEREQAWRGPSMRAGLAQTDQQAHAKAPAHNAASATTAEPQPAAAGHAARPPAQASQSLSRMLVLAVVAGVFGAGAMLLAWVNLKQDPPVQERMVVIAKESAVPEQALGQLTKPLPVARQSDVAEPDPPATKQPSAAVAPRVAAPAVRSTVAPDAQAISRVFARKQRLVQGCFSKHASAEGELPQLSLHFRVSASGAVESASIQPSSLTDRPLGQCLLELARSTNFGPQQKGVSFHIPISAEKVPRSSL